MTTEDKQLLLKYLCAILPYGVKVRISSESDGYLHENITILDIDNLHKYILDGGYYKHGLFYKTSGFQLLPYLRPLSSMTEEEKDEMHRMLSPEGTALYRNDGIAIPMNHFGDFVPYEFMNRIIDWLNAHHFDFRNLIERGLAIDCTGLNVY